MIDLIAFIRKYIYIYIYIYILLEFMFKHYVAYVSVLKYEL
jgi:hypothetical protein